MSKIILVPPPPPRMNASRLPVVGERGTTAWVDMPNQSYADPMADYRAWYGPHCYDASVTHDDIQLRFWEQRDFRLGLEAVVEHEVLVQNMGHRWNLAFTELADYTFFHQWFNERSIGEVVNIDLPYGEAQKLHEWLRDNTQSRHRVVGGNYGPVKVGFYDPKEAVHFKLMWVTEKPSSRR